FAGKRGADFELAEDVLSGGVGGLCLRTLGLNPSRFRAGVTLFLLLLEKLHVGIGASELILRILNFAGGSRSGLLQTLQGLEVALRGVALGASFGQLGFEG